MPGIFLPSSFIHWYQTRTHRVLTPAERAIIDSLERQRISSRRNNVLAAINDPSRRHTILLSTYAIWFQQTFCPGLDSVIFAPETLAQAARKYDYLTQNLSGLTIRTARQKRWVPCAPFGIAIMFGADLYCPSYPNWRRPKIQTFLSWVVPSMALRNHLILIIGDATHRRTAFADAFNGRIRRTRHPEIHCFRPRQITLAAYKKIDVEQVSRPASPEAEEEFSEKPQASAQGISRPGVQWRGLSRASSPLPLPAKLA